MFIEKDEKYYSRLIKEQASENGQIVVLREKEGKVSGILLLTEKVVSRSGNPLWRRDAANISIR